MKLNSSNKEKAKLNVLKKQIQSHFQNGGLNIRTTAKLMLAEEPEEITQFMFYIEYRSLIALNYFLNKVNKEIYNLYGEDMACEHAWYLKQLEENKINKMHFKITQINIDSKSPNLYFLEIDQNYLVLKESEDKTKYKVTDYGQREFRDLSSTKMYIVEKTDIEYLIGLYFTLGDDGLVMVRNMFLEYLNKLEHE